MSIIKLNLFIGFFCSLVIFTTLSVGSDNFSRGSRYLQWGMWEKIGWKMWWRKQKKRILFTRRRGVNSFDASRMSEVLKVPHWEPVGLFFLSQVKIPKCQLLQRCHSLRHQLAHIWMLHRFHSWSTLPPSALRLQLTSRSVSWSMRCWV